MSDRSLSRRMARAERQQPVWTTGEQRTYLAFMAAQHDLPVAELAAETETILAQARQQGVRSDEVVDRLATAGGWTPEAIRAEAAASLVAWREQQR